jgi:hypothetical protein
MLNPSSMPHTAESGNDTDDDDNLIEDQLQDETESEKQSCGQRSLSRAQVLD